jgi:hypothetical protein
MPSYTPGDSYPVLPVPAFADPSHTYGSSFGDAFHAPAVLELLASTDGWTQREVVLAGGNGVIPTGTVLGVYASGPNAGLYGVYSAGASDTGLQTPLGFLRNGVDTGGSSSPSGQAATVQLGLMVDRGVVNYAVTSGIDANAVTKLNGRIDNVVSRFYF